MVKIEHEDEDDESLSVALSSGCCLKAIALYNGDMILDYIINFVSENVASPNWKLRYSSLIALGGVTEGPTRARFVSKVMPGLQSLMGMFNDPNGKVREAISWVFFKICETHADVIGNKEAFSILIPQLLKSIQDRPRVSLNVCKCIENLSTSLLDKEPSLFDPYFVSLFNALIQNSQRHDFDNSNDLMLASFLALQDLSIVAQPAIYPQVYELMQQVVNFLKSTISPEKVGDKNNVMLQNYLTGIMQTFLAKIGDKIDD